MRANSLELCSRLLPYIVTSRPTRPMNPSWTTAAPLLRRNPVDQAGQHAKLLAQRIGGERVRCECETRLEV